MKFDISPFMPQRPPMLFIDHVEGDGGNVCAVATVKEDWIILDDAGKLSGAAYFELMAQGFAAISACGAAVEADPEATSSPMGFLVGVKAFEALRSASPGERLRIETSLLAEVGPFSVFKGEVYDSSRNLLAQAQIKVVVADGENALADQLKGDASHAGR